MEGGGWRGEVVHCTSIPSMVNYRGLSIDNIFNNEEKTLHTNLRLEGSVSEYLTDSVATSSILK